MLYTRGLVGNMRINPGEIEFSCEQENHDSDGFEAGSYGHAGKLTARSKVNPDGQGLSTEKFGFHSAFL
jgi:hypothetical protein